MTGLKRGVRGLHGALMVQGTTSDAGKSTLVAILFGHYVADAGTIEAFGKPLPAGEPRAALDAGITFFDTSDINPQMPRWLGLDAFHASHRSNLLRKDRSHYSQFNWTEHDDLPYHWPTP